MDFVVDEINLTHAYIWSYIEQVHSHVCSIHRQTDTFVNISSTNSLFPERIPSFVIHTIKTLG